MLSGNSIYNLNEVTELLSNDLFILSENQKTDRLNNTVWTTNRTDIYVNKNTTTSIIYNNIEKMLSNYFGSMAYENSRDYALSSHNHNNLYNYININNISSYSTFHLSSEEELRNNACLIGEIFLDGLFIPVYIKKENTGFYDSIEDSLLPTNNKVGDIKYILKPTIEDNIDINSTNFDGWVYPDGKTYICNTDEFKEACKLYADNEYATSFTVPNLNSFIKFTTDKTKINYEIIPFNNSIGVHNHNMNFTVNCEASLTYEVPLSKHPGDGGYCHNGVEYQKKTKNVFYTGKVVADCKFNNFVLNGLQVLASPDYLNTESHPSFNYIPVMIYIGKK